MSGVELVLAFLAGVVMGIALISSISASFSVESRYLDGHPALFPEGLEEWEGQVAATERLAVMADRLAELDGAAQPSLDMPDAIAARVPSAVADLVEPAKVTALEKLGAGDRAIRIATSWLLGRARQAAP